MVGESRRQHARMHLSMHQLCVGAPAARGPPARTPAHSTAHGASPRGAATFLSCHAALQLSERVPVPFHAPCGCAYASLPACCFCSRIALARVVSGVGEVGARFAHRHRHLLRDNISIHDRRRSHHLLLIGHAHSFIYDSGNHQP